MANVITASGDKSPSLEYVFDRGRTMSTTAQSSTRQPNRTNKRVLVATGCAVGLLLFWQQLLFRSIMPSAPELSVTILGNVRTDAGWLVFVVSLAITSIICGVRNYVHTRTNLRPFEEGVAATHGKTRTWQLAIAGICMCAGSIATLFFPSSAICVLAGGSLAGIGFALCAALLIEVLYRTFPGDTVTPPLLVAAGCQLLCAIVASLLPKTASLLLLCMLPAVSSLLIGEIIGLLPATQENAGKQAHVANALAKRKAQNAFAVCLVAFFFAILYTNITGFKFNSFHSDELLKFNLSITIAKTLFFACGVALARKHLTSACPLVIITLFGASMLIVVFAPTTPGALLLADSLAAAGRLFAFVYAYLAAHLMHVGRWPHAINPTRLVLGASACAVVLSVAGGSVVQSLIARDSSSFALATAVILYVLLVVSNVIMRTSQDASLTVRLEGEQIDEEGIAAFRAQAVATQHPQLTERETEILKCILLGLTAPTIAERLSISENTAKTHMRRIYRKLEVHSRQELLELAYSTVPPKGGQFQSSQHA